MLRPSFHAIFARTSKHALNISVYNNEFHLKSFVIYKHDLKKVNLTRNKIVALNWHVSGNNTLISMSPINLRSFIIQKNCANFKIMHMTEVLVETRLSDAMV